MADKPQKKSALVGFGLLAFGVHILVQAAFLGAITGASPMNFLAAFVSFVTFYSVWLLFLKKHHSSDDDEPPFPSWWKLFGTGALAGIISGVMFASILLQVYLLPIAAIVGLIYGLVFVGREFIQEMYSRLGPPENLKCLSCNERLRMKGGRFQTYSCDGCRETWKWRRGALV